VLALPAQDASSVEQRLAAMQVSYEARIAALEAQVQSLRAVAPTANESTDDVALGTAIAGVMGRLDQTTRFSNRFNPAIGLVVDVVASASSRPDAYAIDNQFHLRTTELSLAGRVDPHVNVVATLAATTEGVELEEAFAVWDRGLPDTFTLRAGRLPVDFGRASPLHDHELPFTDKPGALQELLGGRALTTGVALHHWFGLGDVPLRWSFGVGNRLDGDAHAVQGPLVGHGHDDEHSGPEPFGDRDGDMLYTARITAHTELSTDDDLQVGASIVHAPAERYFYFSDPPLNTMADAATLDRTVSGVDITWRHTDPSNGSALTVGGEWLWWSAERADDSAASPLFARTHADGGWVFVDYAFDRHWSVSARAERFRHLEDRDLLWRGWNAALSWNIDEYHRLRVEGGGVQDDGLAASWHFVQVQWTLVLGSHGHALAW
jgi:hypothetical protein